MVSCCVPFCKIRSGKSKGISFHEFPVDPILFQKWWKAIKGEDFVPDTTKYYLRVCSLHFKDTDYRSGLKLRCLKPQTVPSIFPEYPPSKAQELLPQRKRTQKKTFKSCHPKVCENHFKKSDIETEISAYDPKTGKTLTVPLIRRRLKTEVIPSIFPQSLNSTSSLPIREDPDEKRMRIEEEQLSLALQKSLKENCDTSQPDDAAGLSRISEDIRQKKSTKRKKSDKEMSHKKAKTISNSSSEENSQSNDISQSHNLNKSRDASQSSKDLLKKKDAKTQQQNQKDSQTSHSQKARSFVSATRENTEVQIKEEPPWEEEYNVSANTSKNKPKGNSKDKETNETVLESCDITFYKKPLKIDKRDDAFGKFVACEMSDLHGNPELYLKTQQSILNILVEAHFELMSAT